MVGREGGLGVISLIVPVAVSTIGCTLGGPNSNFFYIIFARRNVIAWYSNHGRILVLLLAKTSVRFVRQLHP